MLSDMANTTESSFQDDGLWRKLLTRAQKGTTTQAFFVIDVVEDSLHTSLFCKLILPTAFMRNHFQSLNERIILEGPDDYQWPTMLGLQWDSQPCLMHGWKEFAAAYNLEIQDQVVFLLVENSHFLVQVYDVNNKVKNRRIFASPVQVNNYNGDMRAKNVRQAETRAPHSDLPSMHGVKTSDKKNVIILDSSDEEEEAEKEKEKEDVQVRVKHIPIDVFRMGGTLSKMTLRSAKKVEEVDTQDHSIKDVSPQSVKKLESSDHSMKDCSPQSVKKLEKRDHLMMDGSPQSVQKLEKRDHSMMDGSPRSVKKLEKSDHSMKFVSPQSIKKLEKSDYSMKDVSKEQKQGHVQLNGDDEIMDRELGKSKRSDSAPQSAPSSPEHVSVLKRSRRLQLKSGDYLGDDLGRATSFFKSKKLYRLSQALEKLPPRLYEVDAKDPEVVTKAAFKRVPGSEILTSCCSTQQSTMKRQQRQLQESTSKITEPPPPVTVPELHAHNTESTVPAELTAPEMPGGVPAVKLRPKAKISKEMAQKRTEKVCLSEDEANKRPNTRVEAPGGKTLNLLYVSRRRPVTAQERQDTVAAARTFAMKSTGRPFVLQLTTSQVYCGFHLKVQSEFVKAMQLPLSKLIVTLSDASGKAWEIEWLGDHPKWPGLHSAGWTRFVLEHYLEEGDVCVFQKSKVAHNSITVDIFPVVPLVTPPEPYGWRSHYLVPEVARTVTNSQLPDQS